MAFVFGKVVKDDVAQFGFLRAKKGKNKLWSMCYCGRDSMLMKHSALDGKGEEGDQK